MVRRRLIRSRTSQQILNQKLMISLALCFYAPHVGASGNFSVLNFSLSLMCMDRDWSRN